MFVGGLVIEVVVWGGGGQVKPGFVYSVSIFPVEVLGMFNYFTYFPDYVGMVSADVGYNFCLVESVWCLVVAVFSYC
jgi:hypothetical protein